MLSDEGHSTTASTLSIGPVLPALTAVVSTLLYGIKGVSKLIPLLIKFNRNRLTYGWSCTPCPTYMYVCIFIRAICGISLCLYGIQCGNPFFSFQGGGGSHRLRPATIKIKYEERGEKKREFNDHQIRLGQKKNWYLIGDGRKGIESL